MFIHRAVRTNQLDYRRWDMEDEDKDPKHNPESDRYMDLTITPLEEPEDGVFSAYANVVNLDWTLYDVRMRFGELMQVPNAEDPSWKHQHAIVLERAAIRVPWHQAKNLRDLLDGIIKNYEEINGKLFDQASERSGSKREMSYRQGRRVTIALVSRQPAFSAGRYLGEVLRPAFGGLFAAFGSQYRCGLLGQQVVGQFHGSPQQLMGAFSTALR